MPAICAIIWSLVTFMAPAKASIVSWIVRLSVLAVVRRHTTLTPAGDFTPLANATASRIGTGTASLVYSPSPGTNPSVTGAIPFSTGDVLNVDGGFHLRRFPV